MANGNHMSLPLTIPLIETSNGVRNRLGAGSGNENTPKFLGMPLKYISLVTLAVQNALLTIIMHYSRVSIPSSRAYSPAAAVLMNELLKGFISLVIAFSRLDGNASQMDTRRTPSQVSRTASLLRPAAFIRRCHRLGREVFSPDCWKLSIPAILYVIQNNLQYVAASHLEAATFQVSYQMKILTTAGFSVLLLRKRLSTIKWVALLGLALGVGIVQLQSGAHKSKSLDEVDAFKGFLAVIAACFTSGLAGVYFEMVLKGSQADLWVRNVQLSLFSLLPALVPILATPGSTAGGPSWFWRLFENFGGWAWATVGIQVFGGLVTAVVIKYSDNILKGFATSLSIVISSLASVAVFDFRITPCFVIGSAMVLSATWLYNKPETKEGITGQSLALPKAVTSALSSRQSISRKGSYPGSPVEPNSPILGLFDTDKKRSSLGMGNASPRVLAAALGRLLSQQRANEDNNGSRGDVLSELGGGFGGRAVSGSASGQSSPLYASLGSRSNASTPPPSSPTSRNPSRNPSTTQLPLSMLSLPSESP